MEVYAALQKLPEGEPLEVLSDYAPAKFTVPSLIQDLNYSWRLQDHDDGLFTIVIEKSAAPVG